MTRGAWLAAVLAALFLGLVAGRAQHEREPIARAQCDQSIVPELVYALTRAQDALFTLGADDPATIRKVGDAQAAIAAAITEARK